MKRFVAALVAVLALAGQAHAHSILAEDPLMTGEMIVWGFVAICALAIYFRFIEREDGLL